MGRRNRRRENQDLATAITQALVAVLPNVMVQIQRQLNSQQPPNNSPDQNPVNHTHTEPPVYNGKAEGSTDTQTKTSTTMASTATSKRATKKRKGNPHHYAIPAVPLQQIPPATQPNKKPYNGTFPYCNTCTHHHPPTSVCRFCTNCNRFGHFINNCRRANQFGAQNNQARDSFNSPEVQFNQPVVQDNSTVVQDLAIVRYTGGASVPFASSCLQYDQSGESRCKGKGLQGNCKWE